MACILFLAVGVILILAGLAEAFTEVELIGGLTEMQMGPRPGRETKHLAAVLSKGLHFYRSLKDKYPIYMFTTSALQKEPEIAKELEGVFDKILVTQEMGLHKKDPDSYRTVARELGYQPEEILYIDDTPHRAAAAEAAGMRVILFTSNAEAIPEIKRILNQ